MRSASRRSIILSISLGKRTWVLVSLFKVLFVISCLVLKSSTMPSYNASLPKMSFELITIHDKPDGVIGYDHNRFPYVNNVVNADETLHSTPSESSFEFKNNWAWTLSGLLKNFFASSLISVGMTDPWDDAISIICWNCGGTFLNDFDDDSLFLVWISVNLASTSCVVAEFMAKSSSGWRRTLKSACVGGDAGCGVDAVLLLPTRSILFSRSWNRFLMVLFEHPVADVANIFLLWFR